MTPPNQRLQHLPRRAKRHSHMPRHFRLAETRSCNPRAAQLSAYRRRKDGEPGFFISSDGLLITNAYVGGNHKFVTMYLPDGKSVEVSTFFVDDGHDLAVVRVPGNGYPYLKLSRNTPDPGADVFAIVFSGLRSRADKHGNGSYGRQRTLAVIPARGSKLACPSTMKIPAARCLIAMGSWWALTR